MEVNVPRDSGSGHPPLIEAQVVSVRMENLLQPFHRIARHMKEIQPFLGGQQFHPPDVSYRRHHQMSIVVGKTIEQRKAEFPPCQNKVF